MNRALYAAASGMAAQQQQLDVVAGNLANADVPGFKAATRDVCECASATRNDARNSLDRDATPSSTQGKLMASGGPFDVALDGPGLFVVERDGKRGFTRAGSFARAADGSLRNDEGWRLDGRARASATPRARS